MEGLSIIHPQTCGFAKVLAYVLNRANLTLEERIAQYENQFMDYKENFNIPSETHRRNLPKIVGKITALGKRKKEIKEKILHTFPTKTCISENTTY